MLARSVFFALALAIPCMGHASFIVSEEDGSSTFLSYTGRTSQNGTLVPRFSGNTQIITQIGSSGSQATPPQAEAPDPIPVIANWQVIPVSQPNAPPVSQDAYAVISVGSGDHSLIYPALRLPVPPLLQISPVNFQVVLAPSVVPESGTALLWAMGAIGAWLASKQKNISASS